MSEQNQFEITYNDRSFVIDPIKFCEMSPIFRQIYNPEVPGVSLENYYEVDDFITFLKAVQNLDYEITSKNYQNLALIANEWGVQSILNEIEAFKERNNLHNSASNLADNIRRGLPVEGLIREVAADFNNVYHQEVFLKLPLEVMEQILTIVFENREELNINEDYLSQVVYTLLDNHGANISPFFEKMNLDELPDRIVYALISNPNFNRKKVAEQIVKITQKLLGRLKSQRIDMQDKLNRATIQNGVVTSNLGKLQREVREIAVEIDTLNDNAELEEHKADAYKERTKQMEEMLTQAGVSLPSKKKDPRDNPFKPYIPDTAPSQTKAPKQQTNDSNKFRPYVPSQQAAAPAPKPAQNAKSPKQNPQSPKQNSQPPKQNAQQQQKPKQSKNKKKKANANKFAPYHPN